MKIKLILLLTTLNYLGISQSYSWISSYYYSHVQICIEYTYKSKTSNSFNYGNALATKQSQYDEALKEVNAAYGQMVRLQLLNKINQERLDKYRKENFESIKNQASTLDLSVDANKNWAIQAFRSPTNDKYIKNEIKVLNRIGKEIDYMEHPAGQLSTEQASKVEARKHDIVWFLYEYENTHPENLKTLLKKYDLELIMFGDFLE